MKKLLFSLVISFAFAALSFGQNVKPVVKLSPEYKLERNKILKGHLHSDNSGHYMYFSKFKAGGLGLVATSLFTKKVTYVLEKYDSKFKKVFSKEYKSDQKGTYGLDIKYFKNKFAWFLYKKDKSNDELKFYMTPISMDGKSEKAKLIAKFKYEKRKDFPEITWQVSPDTTKIVFIATSDRDSKKENYEAYISVLDNDFNILWDKKIKIPVTERRINTFQYKVNEEGDVFFLGKVYESDRKKESKRGKDGKKKAYEMNLYKVSEGVDNYEEFEVKLNNAYIKGIGIEVNKTTSDLACVGFFGDTFTGPVQGAFFMRFNGKDGEKYFAKKRKFTPKELNKFGRKNTSKDKKSKDTGLDDEFKFREIIFRENGEIFVTAEENYVTVSTSTDGRGNTTTTYHYNSNHIVVLKIDTEGEVENVSMIPKRQRFQTPIYGYHATLKTPERIYFLYNDDADNFRKRITDPDKYKRISRVKHCIAVLTYIGENGKLVKRELFNKKEADSVLMPGRSSQFGDNQLFFFNVRAKLLGKNTVRFGTLSLKE